MGIKLVRFGFDETKAGTLNHNELIKRDSENSHPMSAITGLLEAFESSKEYTDEQVKEVAKNVIKGTIDTSSLHLDYDQESKKLSGNVKILESDNNALIQMTDGLFVDKYPDIETQNSITVSLEMEGKGETLKTMYDSGMRISHNKTSWSNQYNPSEATSWYFDDTLGSFVQPLNTETYTGFVSTVKYKTYVHRATLKSTNGDNDGIGLIIAFAFDSTGNPNTLSVVLNPGGESHVGNWRYALVYNKSLPNEQVLFTQGNQPGGTVPSNAPSGGWNNATIRVEVNKTANTIICATSNYNTNEINANTLIKIDLDDYAWGKLFREKVQYGYSTQSQPYSFFQDIYFSGKGPLTAEVNVSNEADNALEVKDDGLYVKKEDAFANVQNTSTISLTSQNKTLSADINIVDIDTNSVKAHPTGLYVPEIYFEPSSPITVSTKEKTSTNLFKDTFNNGTIFRYAGAIGNDHVIGPSGGNNDVHLNTEKQYRIIAASAGWGTPYMGVRSKDEYESYDLEVEFKGEYENCITVLLSSTVVDGIIYDLPLMIAGGTTAGKNTTIWNNNAWDNNYSLAIICDIRGASPSTSQNKDNIKFMKKTLFNPEFKVLNSNFAVNVKVKKRKNLIDVNVQWSNGTITFKDTLSIDLNDYTYGPFISGKIGVGYIGDGSNAASSMYCTEKSFYNYDKKVYVPALNISKDTKNGLEIKEDGLYIDTEGMGQEVIYTNEEVIEMLEEVFDGYI